MIATLATLLLASSPAVPESPGSGLLFASNADGDSDLYLLPRGGVEGDEAVQLLDREGEQSWPRWSPDGKRVLFVDERDGASNLAVLDLASGSVEALTDDGVTQEGAWSPDGARVVFRSRRDGNDDLYVQTLASGEVLRLTDDPGSDWGPDWSPDGSTIVYATASTELEAIASVPAAGGERTILTDMPGEESLPRWSRDGRQIAFNAHPNGVSNEIYVMGPGGEDPRRLTFESDAEPTTTSFGPAWSVDGRTLAYTRMTRTGMDLWAVEARGGEPRRLTSAAAFESRPDYGPPVSLQREQGLEQPEPEATDPGR